MARLEKSAAERAAVTEVKVAQAHKDATVHRVEADRIAVEAAVAAKRLHAAAYETRYAIDAAGKRAVYDAENTQSTELIALQVKLAVIERLEAIIRESAKPLERIEGIKIVQLFGGDPSGVDSLSDQVVASALKYRTQAPMIDALLRDLSVPDGATGGLVQFIESGDSRVRQ